MMSAHSKELLLNEFVMSEDSGGNSEISSVDHSSLPYHVKLEAGGEFHLGHASAKGLS